MAVHPLSSGAKEAPSTYRMPEIRISIKFSRYCHSALFGCERSQLFSFPSFCVGCTASIAVSPHRHSDEGCRRNGGHISHREVHVADSCKGQAHQVLPLNFEQHFY